MERGIKTEANGKSRRVNHCLHRCRSPILLALFHRLFKIRKRVSLLDTLLMHSINCFHAGALTEGPTGACEGEDRERDPVCDQAAPVRAHFRQRAVCLCEGGAASDVA